MSASGESDIANMEKDEAPAEPEPGLIWDGDGYLG